MKFNTRRILALAYVLALAFALTATAQDSETSSPETTSAAAATTAQFVFVPLGNNTSFGVTGRVREYRMNSTTGALTVVKKGIAAQNIAITTFRDPTHRFLYIVGPPRNSNSNVNLISEYRVNTTTGAITLLPGSPFGTANHQELFVGAIRPDLKFAYILDFQSINILHIISMNPATGAMVKEVGTFNIPGNGFVLFDVRFDPSGRFLYVAEAEANTIDAFVSNPTTGALTPVRGSPFVPRGSAPESCSIKSLFCGGAVAITSNNHLYYVSTQFDGVAEFKIDPNTGALSELPNSPAANPAHEGLDVHATADGKHLYVIAPFSNAIVGYTINQTTGSLTKVTGSPFKVPGPDTFMELDATGKFLYTANLNTVSGFHVNSTTGVLTSVPGSPYSAPGNTGISIVR